jgi:NAD(P)-dependent dehydrogenase (short-subunit alcohol dehydrogenase family)
MLYPHTLPPDLRARHRCEEFARQGCKVYATSRRVETIADFAEGSNIEKFALDVNSDESVAKILEHIAETDGKLDVLVNNAGVIAPGISISRFRVLYHSIFHPRTSC